MAISLAASNRSKRKASERTVSAPALPREERYVIPNLRNACRILKLLGRVSGGLKAADLGRQLGIPVTTTLRIMATLHLENLVRKNGTLYELGPVLIQLGHASLASTEIRSLALPILEKLSTEVGETSHLAISCDNHSLIVAVHDSPHPLRVASRPGFMAELHCSSTGKLFLAYGPAGLLTELYGQSLPSKRTKHTLTSLTEIRQDCEITRRRGYSRDDEELNLGVRCLAAPVFASDGAVVAAVGVTAATIRFTTARVPEIAALVKAAAAELSRLLGYAEPDR